MAQAPAGFVPDDAPPPRAAALPAGFVPDRPPDFTTTNEPPSLALRSAAAAKNLGVAALDTLPALGAAAGGALATPETAGAGTIAGAALGAGAGRGLRDLITQGLGLEPPTSPAAKGGAIALDTAETGVASAVLPGLWEAIRTPGRTAGEVYELARGMLNRVPQFLRVELPPLPKGVAKAPAWILERPAWQTWEQHLPADTPPPAPPPPRTATSMVPAPMPTPPVTPVAAAPPPLTLVPKPAAAASALPDQKALNEAALAARRAAYQARQAAATGAPDAIVPSSGKMRFTAEEMAAFAALRKKGLSLADAEAAVRAMRTLATDLPTTAEAQAAIAARGYKR